MKATQFGRFFISAVLAMGAVTLIDAPYSVRAATMTQLEGLTYSVADLFAHQGDPQNGDGSEIGTHFHSSNGLPVSSINLAQGVAEVGGFFGDEEVRGLSEFDLTNAQIAEADKIEFVFDVADVSELTGELLPMGLFGQPTLGSTVEDVGDAVDVFAIAGDYMKDALNATIEAEDLEDYQAAPLQHVGSLNITGVPVGQSFAFDVTDLLKTQVDQGATSIGFRLQMMPRNLNGGAVSFDNFRLEIEVIPEPATLLVALVGLMFLSQTRWGASKPR